jgi:hypothetical protein
MKRLAIILAGAAAIVALGAAPAWAGTPGSGGGNASTPGHFTYNDAVFGPVTCNEVHHPSNVLPAAQVPAGSVTTGGYDEVTCQLGAVPAGFAGTTVFSGWFSDFGIQANGGLINARVNLAGTAYHGIAWYPFG